MVGKLFTYGPTDGETDGLTEIQTAMSHFVYDLRSGLTSKCSKKSPVNQKYMYIFNQIIIKYVQETVIYSSDL